jgi:peptide/nickel transport system substrate-binding protein
MGRLRLPMLLALLFASALLLAAPLCTAAVRAPGPKPGGTLTLATSIDVPSLEPHLEATDAWHRRKVLIYENLTWVNNNVDVQPQLAESWDIRDGVLYRFKLREGVKFHNGKELDAEDVKYSLERQLDESLGSAGRGDLLMIDTIEAVDRYTVRIRLKQPSGPFLAALGGRYNAIIPKGSAPTGETLRHTAIGTGPFVVEQFLSGQKLVLKKNPNYWEKGRPLLDRLVIQVIPDEQAALAGLRAGTIDLVAVEDPKNFLLVKDDRSLLATRSPALKIDTLELPGDIPPLNNPKVRQAILLALDKPAILQAGVAGLGQVIGGMPPAMSYWALLLKQEQYDFQSGRPHPQGEGPRSPFNPARQLPAQRRDVARAKQLLAEAGYPNGFELKLRTIVGYATMAATAPIISANLKDAGIRVTVETVDLGVWIEDWRARRAPATLNALGGFMDPDLLYYQHFHTQPMGMDFLRWNNAKADELLDKGRSTVEPVARKVFYAELQRLMAEDPICIPLYSADLLNVMQKHVKSYVQHPSGWYYGFKNTWLDK